MFLSRHQQSHRDIVAGPRLYSRSACASTLRRKINESPNLEFKFGNIRSQRSGTLEAPVYPSGRGGQRAGPATPASVHRRPPALPFRQSPGAAASAWRTRKGGGEGTSCRPALLSKALPTTFCGAAEKCPKPSAGYSVSPSALRQQDTGRRERGIESEAENCPLFLPLQRGNVFSLIPLPPD